jgi:hypothetical protein
METAFDYKVFGLNLRSCIRFDALHDASGPPDIAISYGAVPEFEPDKDFDAFGFQVTPGRLLFRRDGIARYMVENGNRITIDPSSSGTELNYRIFIFGSGMAALLMQRGYFVMHGCSVVINGECHAFIGPSGTGKSSLAAAFFKAGYPVLCDDVCVISCDSENPVSVLPGVPLISLWPDAVEVLGEKPDNLQPVRSRINKWGVPISEKTPHSPVALKSIYVINPTHENGYQSVKMTGTRPFRILNENVYRPLFVKDFKLETDYFTYCGHLARRIPIKVLSRPFVPFELEPFVRFILEDIES